MRFSGTVFNAVNKVRSCLRQPIFNDCMASRGRKGRGDTGGAGREVGAKCARDENRDARFQAENEMKLNDS